ncbi:hypothetical protein CONLIGDRAFT_686741 [Coniochaeta ligniaria NRRL 30616]|uniref:Uncharacterized protein n=1 Tax=Coniochaeta ligniaria NRRL 30616 TaxID=1408157 RepID=A0A1J7I6N5_9PEZI|nr:hypothetical protein CONLIGDRAFT_686741 [Coniochaeta ligniaria NRRL 30616]
METDTETAEGAAAETVTVIVIKTITAAAPILTTTLVAIGTMGNGALSVHSAMLLFTKMLPSASYLFRISKGPLTNILVFAALAFKTEYILSIATGVYPSLNHIQLAFNTVEQFDMEC